MILCNNNLQIYSKLKFHFTFKYFTILVSHNNLLIEVAQSVSQKTQSFVEGTQSEIVLELIFISGATYLVTIGPHEKIPIQIWSY